MCEHIKQDLLELIMIGDRIAATELLESWAKEHSYTNTISAIINPVLKQFGQDWGDSDKVSLGQGYVLSKVVEDIFTKAAAESYTTGEKQEKLKGPVVIGNIIDDSHSLGRKLVMTFLQLNGWQVFDLGNDVDPVDFVNTAVEKKAPIIAVSAMMLRTAMNIKEVREEINHRNLQHEIKLAVGGAVFCQRPELVEDVGGDGSAFNAIEVPLLMEKLLKEVEEYSGGKDE